MGELLWARNRLCLCFYLGEISQGILFTCIYAFIAEGAFLLNKFRYSFLLVPYYRLIFTSPKALSTVYAAKIAPLSPRDIP